MSEVAIRAEHLAKMYRLGTINNGTLWKDIQTWIALKSGKDDPHSKIGEDRFSGDEDHFWALKDVNFDILQGDRIGIIGKNGAGKSTLLKILSRVTSPSEGIIKIRGKIASLLEVGTGFNGELTGRENIYLNGAILGMKKRQIDRKLDEIINFSGIEHHIDTPVKRYSSGMYVRLAFAVAAHLDSEILIADEVLAVGDADFQKKALGKMQDLSTGQGRTVLFVSHNISAVKSLCNKGILLDKGRIIADTDLNTCLSLYLKNKSFLSSWTGDVGDDNLRLTHVELNTKVGQIPVSKPVPRGTMLVLTMEYDILQANRNYGFSIEVLNSKSTVICESSVSDDLSEEEFRTLKTKGHHVVMLNIDTSFFGRGTYTVNFDFAICNQKRIIMEEPSIRFEIEEEEQNVLGVPKRHDIIVPNWNWTI